LVDKDSKQKCYKYFNETTDKKGMCCSNAGNCSLCELNSPHCPQKQKNCYPLVLPQFKTEFQEFTKVLLGKVSPC